MLSAYIWNNISKSRKFLTGINSFIENVQKYHKVKIFSYITIFRLKRPSIQCEHCYSGIYSFTIKSKDGIPRWILAIQTIFKLILVGEFGVVSYCCSVTQNRVFPWRLRPNRQILRKCNLFFCLPTHAQWAGSRLYR